MVKNVVSRFLWNCLPAATSRLSWKDVVARLQAGRPGKSGRQTTFHAWRQAGQAGPQIAKRRSPRFGHVVSTSKLIVTSIPTCHGSVSSDGQHTMPSSGKSYAPLQRGCAGCSHPTSAAFTESWTCRVRLRVHWARDGQRARKTMTGAWTMRKPFRHPLEAWARHRTEGKDDRAN